MKKSKVVTEVEVEENDDVNPIEKLEEVGI